MNRKDMCKPFVARVTDGLSRRDVMEGIVRGKIASAILTRRCELGMDTDEFARHLGVSQAEVRNWESGEGDFTIAGICEICEKLSLIFDVVLTEEETYPSGG